MKIKRYEGGIPYEVDVPDVSPSAVNALMKAYEAWEADQDEECHECGYEVIDCECES